MLCPGVDFLLRFFVLVGVVRWCCSLVLCADLRRIQPRSPALCGLQMSIMAGAGLLGTNFMIPAGYVWWLRCVSIGRSLHLVAFVVVDDHHSHRHLLSLHGVIIDGIVPPPLLPSLFFF